MKNNEIKNALSVLDSKVNKLILQTTPATPAPFTLYNWLEMWLKGYKPPTLSDSYIRALRGAIEHIKAVLPDKPLNEYTAPEIMTAIYRVPLSYTRTECYGILYDSFFQAVRLGYILSNPMDGTERVRHARDKGKALTLEEQRQFLQVIDNNPRKTLYLFYLLSGARCSEALSLSWGDIDFYGKRIHIHGTKTPQANRFIPLFPQLCAVLDDLPRDSVNLFPYTTNSVKSHFQRLKRKHGLNFRLHDLRHTFATRCIESGISLFTVSKWLGHKSINTTAGTYAHLLTDFERQEVERFDPKF